MNKISQYLKVYLDEMKDTAEITAFLKENPPDMFWYDFKFEVP